MEKNGTTYKPAYCIYITIAIVYFTNVQSITAVDGGMLVNSFPHATVYTALSLIGIFGVWGLMRTAQSFKISAFVSVFGRKSMGFMTFHFLAQALFFNTIKIIGVSNIPSFCWPIPENMWWLLLTICSILISLVLMRTEELTCFAISKIKNK